MILKLYFLIRFGLIELLHSGDKVAFEKPVDCLHDSDLSMNILMIKWPLSNQFSEQMKE